MTPTIEQSTSGAGEVDDVEEDEEDMKEGADQEDEDTEDADQVAEERVESGSSARADDDRSGPQSPMTPTIKQLTSGAGEVDDVEMYAVEEDEDMKEGADQEDEDTEDADQVAEERVESGSSARTDDDRSGPQSPQPSWPSASHSSPPAQSPSLSISSFRSSQSGSQSPAEWANTLLSEVNFTPEKVTYMLMSGFRHMKQLTLVFQVTKFTGMARQLICHLDRAIRHIWPIFPFTIVLKHASGR
jgi:hypothetical protein